MSSGNKRTLGGLGALWGPPSLPRFPLGLGMLPHPCPYWRDAPPGADPADKTKLEEAAKVIDSLEGLLSDPASWSSSPGVPVFCRVDESAAD